MSQCEIEIIEGHVVGCFTDDYSSTPFLTTGLKTTGIYLYETLCGTFTAVAIVLKVDLVKDKRIVNSKHEKAMFLFEADKVKVLPNENRQGTH